MGEDFLKLWIETSRPKCLVELIAQWLIFGSGGGEENAAVSIHDGRGSIRPRFRKERSTASAFQQMMPTRNSPKSGDQLRSAALEQLQFPDRDFSAWLSALGIIGGRFPRAMPEAGMDRAVGALGGRGFEK